MVLAGCARAADSFLDNGIIRVGVSSEWGGAIDYLAESDNPQKNYVNRHDAGRLIQRSYYGSPNLFGTCITVWPWNPVQGGNCHDIPTGVLELTNDGKTIYTKCQPMIWNRPNERSNAIFETWISLEGRAVRIEALVTFPDEDHAKWRDQELLALYVNADLRRLKYYTGTAPFTGAPITTRLPGSTNEYYAPTEYWAAWVNPSDFGVGVFSQDVMRHTAFRIEAGGLFNDAGTLNPTNYLAVVPRFSPSANSVRREVAYVVLDHLDNIRAFAAAKAEYPTRKAHWEFDAVNDWEGWGGNNIDDTLGVNSGWWNFRALETDPHVVSPMFQIPVERLDGKYVVIRMSSTNSDRNARLSWTRLSDENFHFTEARSKAFTIIPDGQMHTYIVDLGNKANWSGTITQLRLDPVSSGNMGVVSIDYIRLPMKEEPGAGSTFVSGWTLYD